MPLDNLKTIKPFPLNPGGTIGVIAPAGVVQQPAFQQGIERLETMGYTIRLAEGLFEAEGYLAGKFERRVDQVHQVFSDNRVDAVMCARGGFGSLHLLSHIDYDIIRNHPKPFIGFSDITALHCAFFSRAGLVTFHGPMVGTLGASDGQTNNSWQQNLSAGDGGISKHQMHAVKSGQAEGIVAGGNLSTLCHLLGTPFSPSFAGRIVFIEEINEAPYRIDRMLSQMMMAGCFNGLAGLVLGTFKDCGPDNEILGVIERVFKDVQRPILAGLPVGHGTTNLTMPLGVKARLDADRAELVYLESPFKTHGN